LAQETGARSFFPNRIEDLNGVYGQIADELSSQYTIGYTSKNQLRNGAWRRLVVQVSRPNGVPRAKKGYYAPTAHYEPRRCRGPGAHQCTLSGPRALCGPLCSQNENSFPLSPRIAVRGDRIRAGAAQRTHERAPADFLHRCRRRLRGAF